MAEAVAVRILAASNASDLGLRALADLAHATNDHQYRVIGGHMVHLLTYAYPSPDAVARVTADADAGIETVVAAKLDLHESLQKRGYTLVKGNHYEAPSGDAANPLAIDLLVPSTTGMQNETVILGGRGFDAIPGLSLALAAHALDIAVHASLHSGDELSFHVPVPDIEAAVVLKALAWRSRMADKDVSDLCSLMAITHEHKDQLQNGWKLDETAKGARLDAQRALHELLKMIDRQQRIPGMTMAAPRLGALIRRYVGSP
ncbi:hypothetical protein [Rhodococcoides kyotonense]|uniref:Uncharacterized protein n=1 Tax=Rhodococcoides kyotonense TaxID=398843 RepID=A0A239L528_9NOCA|nr:hypothetical protein [Rhodococcus kyotonensis]SNT25717.1 hypothetical protein SAMN05421642_11254 [Rhodococcus kyotonensis]